MVAIIQKTLLISTVLFVFVLAGFLLGKSKFIRTESLYSLANIQLYLCLPLLNLRAFVIDPIEPSLQIAADLAIVTAFSFASMLLVFFASMLVFRFMKKEEREKRDLLAFIGAFPNCTALGLPFIDMFTDGDKRAMMNIIMFGAVSNVLCWTLGAYLITQDRKQISLKNAFLNPPTVFGAIGLLLFFVPQINIFAMDSVKELQQIVNYGGNMTAPLSMVLVGVRLAELSPKELFADPKMYLAVAVRLVLAAALTYLLILPFKLTGMFERSPYILLAPVIAMAMPPATTVVLFAEKYGKEQRFAAAGFVTGTLISLFTLPVAMLLIML